MSKMLNLDEFAKPKKSVTFRGKTYEVNDMTVEVFVQLTAASAKISDDASFADQLKATLEMIKLYIPTMEQETLDSMSFDQVTVLAQFVRGEVAAAEEGAPVAEAPEGAEAKKA